jgi:hypothetical protein
MAHSRAACLDGMSANITTVTDPAWPQVDPEPALELRDCGKVRPAASLQDDEKRHVVDAGVFRNRANTPVANSSTQIQHELARNFPDRVYRVHVGPVIRELPGSGSERSAHSSSVDDRVVVGA